MMVTMDRAGRVVIPKELRERLSLVADAELEIEIDDGALRLVPLRTVTRELEVDGGWPVFRAVPGHRLTDADVQRLRDADQR